MEQLQRFLGGLVRRFTHVRLTIGLRVEPKEVPMGLILGACHNDERAVLRVIPEHRGKPVAVDGDVTFTSDDETKVAIGDRVDSTTTKLVPADDFVGTVGGSFKADARIGEGVRIIEGRWELEVAAPEADDFDGTITTEPKETPPAAAPAAAAADQAQG